APCSHRKNQLPAAHPSLRSDVFWEFRRPLSKKYGRPSPCPAGEPDRATLPCHAHSWKKSRRAKPAATPPRHESPGPLLEGHEQPHLRRVHRLKSHQPDRSNPVPPKEQCRASAPSLRV